MNATMNSTITIMPIILMLVTGMIVLFCDACVPSWKKNKFLSPGVSLLGILISGVLSVKALDSAYGESSVFNGMVIADAFANVCNIILLVTAALAILLAMTYLENKRLNLGEYYVLIVFSTAGGMLVAAATDLIMLFIAVEILSVALYVLAGFARTEEKSEESALKYFLLGAFAAGFLLYGIALIYGGSATEKEAGTTNLEALSGMLNTLMHKHGHPSVMLMAGIALLLVGLSFKAALIPFHQWTPDVYEGAPTSATAFMAASVKVAAFAAILRIFNALAPIHAYWLIAIQVLAVLTMFGGNILAVTQDNVKRMLAYSSIAHAGYLMVAVSAMSGGGKEAHELALRASAFYLLTYALITLGSFGVLIWLSRQGKDCQTLNDLKGLARTNPAPAYIMLIFMLSLGGIPPTMGFLGKWFIVYATLKAGQTGMALALVCASVISIYYYLKIVWMMCFQEPDTNVARETAVSVGPARLSVYVTVIASLLFGFMPNLVNGLMEAASTLLRP